MYGWVKTGITNSKKCLRGIQAWLIQNVVNALGCITESYIKCTLSFGHATTYHVAKRLEAEGKIWFYKMGQWRALCSPNIPKNIPPNEIWTCIEGKIVKLTPRTILKQICSIWGGQNNYFKVTTADLVKRLGLRYAPPFLLFYVLDILRYYGVGYQLLTKPKGHGTVNRILVSGRSLANKCYAGQKQNISERPYAG